MLEQSETDTFQKILEKTNVLLEAGIVKEALQFKLTITASVGMVNFYIGEIRNMEEHQKLKTCCNTLKELLELTKDKNVVELNLDDLFVTLKFQFGNKVIEVAKITLKKKEQEILHMNKFEKIINNCNEKGELQNEKIKQNFEFLVHEISEERRNNKEQMNQIKSQFEQNKKSSEESKTQILKQIKDSSKQIKQELKSIREEQKQMKEMINEIKVETKNLISESSQQICQKMVPKTTNSQKSNKCLLISFNAIIALFLVILFNQVSLQNSFKEQSNQIESLLSNFTNNNQKLQNVSQKVEFLNAFLTPQIQQKQKQHQKLEFYKQQKWVDQFLFDGKTLTKIQNNDWHQFVFFEFVPFDKQFTFKVKIVQSPGKYFMIGVVDYDKQKQQHFSHSSNNAVCYFTNNGWKYPGSIKEGNGVNVGETVEVRVDRRNKIIR